MYPLQAIQNCTERKRRREDVDSPDVPPAKRHHQRHLTATPSKRKARLSTKPALSTQRRYSLRATAERARRNVTQNLAHIPVTPAPLPIPTPVPAPILPTTRIPTKRPRNALEADICEEPPAKRHHQRHLTSPPPKRKTRSSTRAAVPTQSRYSLRTTADRVRRNTAATHNPTILAPIPAPAPAYTSIASPTPVLAKRRRLTVVDDFDVDVSEEPHAKRYRLAPSPSKHASRSSTRPDIAIQSHYCLRMTADRMRRNIAATCPRNPTATPPCFPVRPPARGSMPTSPFFTAPISTSPKARSPAPSSVRTSVRIETRRIPIQSSNTAATPLPLHPLAGIPTRPPVDVSVTGMTFKRTHVPWGQLPEREQTRLSTVWDAMIIRLWRRHSLFCFGGLDTYGRALGLSSCDEPDDLMTLAALDKYPDLDDIVIAFRKDFHQLHEFCNHRAFHDDLDASIDAVLAGLEPLFIPSAVLHRSSHRAPTRHTHYDLLSLEELSFPRFSIRNRVRDIFVGLKPYRTPKPGQQTLELMYGVSVCWGLYFSYSPNKTVEEARKSNMSQDLILAIQELGATIDTATLSPEAISRRAAMAELCFYTLYLTRIVVLSRFLECFPQDIYVPFARSEWAVFQRDPPRTSEGEDIFSVVYRHVAKARHSIAGLKRTAETRFETLVYKNKRLFTNHCEIASQTPFCLAVDEVDTPVGQTPLSGRRPACSRSSVNALFFGFDTP
ncbi:uncharacterized protein STEHIDRAFT_163470 [Stereum hirsutum FP-91666 SS1]|uniref:Uncharacterized protein n=1 Tax=Stereum hirsutum (strain FP-91666) TaxID=721885 RepID=R7RWB6_STEHR|nr:uncharacterized protein STEHIDRAFT_163470 [Stereum hirsutum FP-91666 SS1]EIM79646.1 hypothetical protein STEHIDRAFT_163470 [Stereum hirsutum FP-91666 SS1]